MKLIICLFFSLILTSCKYSSSPKLNQNDTITADQDAISAKPVSAQVRRVELLSDSVSLYRYSLKDTLKEDLNCDGFVDHVYFSEKASTKEIFYFDGKSKQRKVLGRELPLKGDMDPDFAWVDFWGITKDSSTWETIVEDGEIVGSRTVSLNCTSIVVRKEEVGGGIITFMNGDYGYIKLISPPSLNISFLQQGL